MSAGHKVLVTVPQTGWIHTEVCSTLLRMMASPVDNVGEIVIEFPGHRPIEASRSHTACKVRDGDYDWWVSIDDDNPPIKNPLELIQYDKDYIGLPTPCISTGNGKANAAMWNVWEAYDFGCPLDKPIRRDSTHDELPAYKTISPGVGLQQVGAVGTGSFVLRASILKDIPDPFCSVYDPQGRLICGSDLWFCRRLREKGFDIWTHWGYPCQHIKETDLRKFVAPIPEQVETVT